METMAVSPLSMYSRADASASLIQPVPVVVTTATTFRSSPRVRTSSSAASAAAPLMSSAEFMPAYTRMGSVALAPLNFESSSTVGPFVMKMRPWLPNDFQLTSEPGPPDRSEVVGAGLAGSVSSLTDSNELLTTFIATRTTTPLSSAIVNVNSRATTTTAETRGGAMRST
ncbi:MAG: hypothetical protein JWQ86_3193 [Mycobacterium sp.]|jgi:hypothetical protein|nr:hypothetical protein [Mycobacterium sp.]MDT5215691.1 hypothetical protein [Mycobacterium sp.]